MNARKKNKQTRNESRNKSPEKREKWKIEFVLLFRIGWKSLTHFMLWTYKRRRRDSPHNNYNQQKHTERERRRERRPKDDGRVRGWKMRHMILSPFIFGGKNRKKWKQIELSWTRCYDTFHGKIYVRQKLFHLLDRSFVRLLSTK